MSVEIFIVDDNSDIRNILNKEAQSFGIDVIDVRIMRADLPETNSFAINYHLRNFSTGAPECPPFAIALCSPAQSP